MMSMAVAPETIGTVQFKKGRAGGFVGFNNEGLFKNNEMYLADVVRGTEKSRSVFRTNRIEHEYTGLYQFCVGNRRGRKSLQNLQRFGRGCC